jgi:hypothetical protein
MHPSDTEEATLLQRQDLVCDVSVVSDRRTTRCIASAMHTGGELVTKCTTLEDVVSATRSPARLPSHNCADREPSAYQTFDINSDLLAKAGRHVLIQLYWVKSSMLPRAGQTCLKLLSQDLPYYTAGSERYPYAIRKVLGW